MTMTLSTVAVAMALAALVVWAIYFGGKLPEPFGFRSCQGRSWRRAFPEASKNEIRQFLAMFTECFAFKDREKLKLHPNDRLLDIYKALYPHKWQADALEFETLAEALQTEHGVSLDSIWHDGLTLGELFAHVSQSKRRQNDTQQSSQPDRRTHAFRCTPYASPGSRLRRTLDKRGGKTSEGRTGA